MKHKFLVSLFSLLCIAIGGFAIAGEYNQKALIQKQSYESGENQKITAEIKPRKIKSNILSASPTTAFFNSNREDIFNSPSKISPSGATVYGFLAWDIDFYGKTEYTYEFREIMTDGQGATSLWDSQKYLSLGFVRDGKLYAYGHDSDAYSVYETYYGVWDINTGKPIEFKKTDNTNFSNTVICGAYDSDSDKFYAYTYNRNGSGYMLRTSSSEDMSKMTTINSQVNYNEICLSMAYNPIDRTLYGVTTEGKFVKVNAENGSTTEIFDTKISIDSNPTAMIYSPADNAMLWNVNYTSGIAAFYSIDIKNKRCTKIEDWVEEERYSFFACNDPAIEGDAPGNPTLKSIDFAQGSTSGSVSYIMPTTTQNGQAITEAIGYNVLVNDVEMSSGTASAGETVTVDLNLTNGYQSIKCYCTLNGKKSQEIIKETYIGNDIPLAPTNVKLGNDGIRWDAVTQGINGGYINTSAITYDVYVNDEKVGSSKYPIYAYEFEKGKTISAYTAKVYAIHAGLQSEPGVSNTVIHGDPYTLPATFTPTQQESLLFNYVDANEDGTTWKFDNTTPCFYNYFNLYNDANDWLITPPIKFTDVNSIYEISLDAAASAGQYTEAFEVYIGATASPDTMVKIFGRDDINHSYFKTYSDIFTIDAAGVYYIGIRATSKAAQYILMLNNLRVSQSDRTANVPNVVTNITHKVASEGGLNTTVFFNMPETDMKGNALDKSTELTATIISPVETLTVSGKPGAKVRKKIETLQGNNVIKIYAENSYGAGRTTESIVYTGVDTPDIVTGIKSSVSEDNMTIHLTWNAPTIGINGGYIRPDELTYRICYYSDYLGWTVDTSIDPITTNSFNYTIDKGVSLGAYNIGIVAVNEAGQCPAVSSIYVVAGEPYTLPMVETFPNGMASCNPMLSWTPTEDYKDQAWFVDSPGKYAPNAAYSKGSAIVGYGQSALSKGRLSLAKFSTEGATNPVFTFDYYFRGIDSDILAYTYGMSQPVKIGSTADDTETNGWGTMSITLPEEFQNKKWVELYFDATYPVAYTFVIIGQYEIRNIVANDLAVTSVTGPSLITIDQKAKYVATVENAGFETAGTPYGKWKIYNNGRLIQEESAVLPEVTIEPGDKTTIEFELEPTINHVGKIEVVYELDAEDMNNANNSASTLTEIKNNNNTIAVSDLRATDSTDTSISLEWSDLQLNFGDGSFEDNTPFEITPTLSPFKNIDGDGAALNYFSNWACPNQGAPAGWVVWNAPQVNAIMASYSVIGEYKAYDGDNFLIAMSPMWDMALGTAPTADDWLISEEIKGGTEVSFQAQPITNVYGAETIEILASSTTDNIEAFTLVASFKVGDPSKPDEMIEWEECRATLPADARYFAIRYVSKDIMGIIIDDIQYTSVNDGLEVIGYDILRDDITIEENFVGNTYTDNTITDREAIYKYNVVPVLNNGSRGTKSNDAIVSPAGIDSSIFVSAIYASKGLIIIKNHLGEKVSISTLDGKIVSTFTSESDCAKVEVEPGIYIVKAGRTTAKLIVK